MRVAKTVEHTDPELTSSPGHIEMTTIYSITRQFMEKEMQNSLAIREDAKHYS